MMISSELVSKFQEDGYLLVKSFYDIKIIKKLKREICNVMSILAKYHSIELREENITELDLDAMYKSLCQKNRKFHNIIYDTLKNIPAFMQLIAVEENFKLCARLLNSDSIGIAAKSHGMRIDRPMDEVFRTDWHQDFHSHARSKKGLVFWTSLFKTTLEMGALEILPGSHKEGIRMLIEQNNDSLQDGEYTKIANSVKIEGIEELCSKSSISPIPCSPGDLIVFDYNLLHRSGLNKSDQCRWTIQIRYFDFEEPWGIEHGWPGSITTGKKYEDVIPEFLRKVSK